jgi:uncharacterized protein (DUF3084 family)
MDFLPIAVLILFVLLGGGIAVFADELGRRIGKKRLSLGRRFRPKTTARIITFISGCSITLLTIILISVVSSDVRVWLREGHRAIEQRDQLNRDLGALRSEQNNLKNANSTFKDENEKLLTTRKELQVKVTDQQKKLTELQKSYSESEARVAGLEGKIGGLNVRLASVDRSIALKTKEKEAAEASRRKAQHSLRVLKGTYKTLDSQYRQMFIRERDLDLKLQAKEKEVADKEHQIAEKVQEIVDKTSTIEAADAEIRRLTGDKDRLQDEIALAQGDIRDKRLELAQLNTRLEGLEDSTIKVRLTPLIYAMGEELLRLPIPAGMSKDQVRDQINQALAKAKLVAREHGAQRANKVDYADMTGVFDEQNNPVSVETQKSLLASQMAGSSEEQVILVTSFSNAFANEGVYVRISGMPNPVVYTTGQTLAEIRVDGRQEPAKILKSLNELGPRIRTRALSDKMIPIQKGDMSLGSVSAEDILLLVRQIQDSGGSVRVRARAKRQTRAADPLELDFEVR